MACGKLANICIIIFKMETNQREQKQVQIKKNKTWTLAKSWTYLKCGLF